MRQQLISEIDSSYSAIGMNLNPMGLNYQKFIIPQRLKIIGTVCSSSKIGQIEMNLIPTLV